MLVLSSAAYLFAWWALPEDQVFLGFLANSDDSHVYLSWMREGAQGRWLSAMRVTPEPHDPALLVPLYKVLGKIARALGWSNEAVFHLARLLGGVALLLAANWLCTECLPAGIVRQSAFLLVCLSSGMGWLLTITGLADKIIVPVDIRVPESSTFLTIFTSPHFVIGVTFELLTFVLYLGAGRRRGYLFASSLCLFFLSITLVYNVIVVAVALMGYTLVRCAQERRLVVPELWRTIAVGLPCMPVIVYYYVLLNVEPFWSIVYGEQDVVGSPGPLALALGYGIVLGLAVWGLVHWVRQQQWSRPQVCLATWVVSNGALLYAPLAFQGKLLAGWHVGLCLIAAVGLHDGLLPWLGRASWFSRLTAGAPRAWMTARNVVLILTVPTTLLVALIGFRVAILEHYYPYYLPVDDVDAVRWLAEQTDEGAVLLSSYGIGNYWVGQSEGRAFLGHQFAVLEPKVKDGAMRRFFSGQASDSEMRRLVASYGINYVFYGTLERQLGEFDPDRIEWLLPVHRSGDVTVYGVVMDDR